MALKYRSKQVLFHSDTVLLHRDMDQDLVSTLRLSMTCVDGNLLGRVA